jgi:hypothetical protein
VKDESFSLRMTMLSASSSAISFILSSKPSRVKLINDDYLSQTFIVLSWLADAILPL